MSLPLSCHPPPLVGLQHRSQSSSSPQSRTALGSYDVQQSIGPRSFPARTRPSTADVRSNLDKRQHDNAVRQQLISTAAYGRTVGGDRSSAPEAQELYCPFRRMSFSS
ncbi:hypothetical protein CYMTET_56360 [Cymbomonas tetramitiformis]|uniref:Uncharacterized protein n=1 Tax=Cymbomonas tetramitiformis TaxID=36881 RepID=A0AAE0EME6_9CHLO|nr:hypothetical protein CYMTET_56360 [Cymbomonas tetramitiformis]